MDTNTVIDKEDEMQHMSSTPSPSGNDHILVADDSHTLYQKLPTDVYIVGQYYSEKLKTNLYELEKRSKSPNGAQTAESESLSASLFNLLHTNGLISGSTKYDSEYDYRKLAETLKSKALTLKDIPEEELEKCKPKELTFEWITPQDKEDLDFIRHVGNAYNKLLEKKLSYIKKPTLFKRILLKFANLLLKPIGVRLYFRKFHKLDDGTYVDFSNRVYKENAPFKIV